MKDSTIRKNVELRCLLILTLALSGFSHASETKNQNNLVNFKTVQLDVHNSQITGIIENKTLKHVLENLSEKLGFTLHSGDDLARYRVSLNYNQKDVLVALKEMLDAFNYVITTNSNLSIDKIFVLGLKYSQSAETEEFVPVVAEIETTDQPLILNDSSEDIELPSIPVSTELQVFDRGQFFEQLEQEMPQLDI